jgi:hypothetical protein
MAAALAAALIGGLLAAAEAKSTKPPILLIVADDLVSPGLGLKCSCAHRASKPACPGRAPLSLF